MDRMGSEEVIVRLHNSRLMHMVSMDQARELVENKIGKTAYYERGEAVIREGENIDCLAVILSGKVSVERAFSDGSSTQLYVLHEKAILGVEALSQIHYRSYYYFCAQTDLVLYEIPVGYFRELSTVNPETQLMILNHVMTVLSHDYSRQHEKLDVLSSGKLRTRIQTYLYYQAKKYHSSSFDISFNREQMASYLCVNRSALSRELSRMQEEGLLEVEGKHFTLHYEI
jgi:CRP-like cAMP-binding protein